MTGPRTDALVKPIDDTIIDFIAAYQRRHRVSPSYREIAEGVGLSRGAVAAVHAHLARLTNLGRVKVHGRRNIEILGVNPLERFASHELIAELERRDNDPAWAGPIVCPCGNRAGSVEARDCATQICPLRGDNREAA